MDVAKSTTYQDVLDRLLACGPVKTWSLIVTILGDLASEDGGRVPGPVITLLTEPMGMKPEALRVAIHRLRRDGWITSEREGRTSLYGLTAHGRTLTREVSDRVYSGEVAVPETWQVLIAQSTEAMQGLDVPDLLQIGPRSALLPGAAPGLPETVLAWEARPGAIPAWVKAVLVPRDLAQAYEALAGALAAALALTPPESRVERAVLRLLALHQWRRLVLRHGAATEVLMGPDWAGVKCRARVTDLLARLERPEPAALAGGGAATQG